MPKAGCNFDNFEFIIFFNTIVNSGRVSGV